MSKRWIWLFVLFCLSWQMQASEELKVLRLAAEEAFAQGRADQVLRIVPRYSSDPDLRLLRMRAQMALGQHAAAAEEWGLTRPGISLAQATARLQDWPRRLQAQAAQLAGEIALHQDRDSALIWWTLALDSVATGIDQDHLLLALSELAADLERWNLAERSAQILWRRSTDEKKRFRAAEILAHALMRSDTERALQHIQAVLVQPELDDASYHRLILLAAYHAIDHDPFVILRLCIQAQNRLELPAEDPIFFWHALALARLDATRGYQALQQLHARWQTHPLLIAERERLQAQQTAAQSPRERMDQAAAALALGEWTESRNLLEPLISTHARALALWARNPEADLEHLVGAPSAQTQEGGLALIEALSQRGRQDLAWRVTRQLLDSLLLAEELSTEDFRLLDWAQYLSKQHAPQLRPRILAKLRRTDRTHALVGQSWAELAHQQQASGDAQAAQASWLQALRFIPSDAAWASFIATRVMEGILHGQPSWQPLAGAERPDAKILDRIQAIVDVCQPEETPALLWLQAQTLVAAHRVSAARQVLTHLRSQLPTEQQGRIDAVLKTLSE